MNRAPRYNYDRIIVYHDNLSNDLEARAILQALTVTVREINQIVIEPDPELMFYEEFYDRFGNIGGVLDIMSTEPRKYDAVVVYVRRQMSPETTTKINNLFHGGTTIIMVVEGYGPITVRSKDD